VLRAVLTPIVSDAYRKGRSEKDWHPELFVDAILRAVDEFANPSALARVSSQTGTGAELAGTFRGTGISVASTDGLGGSTTTHINPAHITPTYAAPTPSREATEPVAWGWIDPTFPEVGFRILHPNRDTAVELWRKTFSRGEQEPTLTPLYTAPSAPREPSAAMVSLAGSLCEALYIAFPAGDHHDSQPCNYCLTRVRNSFASQVAQTLAIVESVKKSHDCETCPACVEQDGNPCGEWWGHMMHDAGVNAVRAALSVEGA